MELSFKGRDGVWRQLPLSPVDNVSHTPSPLELNEDQGYWEFAGYKVQVFDNGPSLLLSLTPLSVPPSLPEWGVSPAYSLTH